MATFPTPPLSTSLGQKDGMVSPTWARWLQQLQAILQGFSVANAWALVAAFSNSWSALGGAQAPRYRKDAAGSVYLGGAMTGGTGNATAFILPVGFRPDTTLQFSVFNYTGATAAAASIKVNADGTVVPYCPTSNAQIWLDGVVFLASG